VNEARQISGWRINTIRYFFEILKVGANVEINDCLA